MQISLQCEKYAVQCTSSSLQQSTTSFNERWGACDAEVEQGFRRKSCPPPQRVDLSHLCRKIIHIMAPVTVKVSCRRQEQGRESNLSQSIPRANERSILLSAKS